MVHQWYNFRFFGGSCWYLNGGVSMLGIRLLVCIKLVQQCNDFTISCAKLVESFHWYIRFVLWMTHCRYLRIFKEVAT